jgi:Tol biopolymer transport system component
MTARNDVNGVISDWLDEQAGRGAPDYLDEILARTSQTRQRPRWSSLERWLPVQTTLRFAPVPRFAWLLVVVALIAALAAAVLVVGSRQRSLPPPFGPASNGAILYGADDNDIYRLDPVSGATTALIAGSTRDSAPRLSPNGTQFLFLRDAALDPATNEKTATIMVAAADGASVRPLTGELDRIQDVAWSHDGARVAVAAYVGGTSTLQLFTVAGQIEPLVIETAGMEMNSLAFRPSDREVTFLGVKDGVNGLYAVGVDGRGLRSIVPRDVESAVLSPDGTKIAYTLWDGSIGSIHVVDVATGGDTIPAFDPPSGGGVIDEVSGWSPDGSRLMFGRFHGNSSVHFAVAPSSGGRVVEIGSGRTTTVTDYAQFSPDGTSVLAYYGIDKSTWLLDPTGSIPDRLLAGTIAERATWERRAP